MFVIPPDYNVKGGLKVYCCNPKLFRVNTEDVHVSSELNEVIIPWLQSCKRKYSIKVCSL